MTLSRYCNDADILSASVIFYNFFEHLLLFQYARHADSDMGKEWTPFVCYYKLVMNGPDSIIRRHGSVCQLSNHAQSQTWTLDGDGVG
jgi:hypothetical protein